MPALLNAGILIYIFLRLPKGRTTDLFSFFVIALVAWQAEDTVLRLTSSVETARFVDRLLCVGWIGLGPLLFHFSARFAGHSRLYSRLSLVAIYLPFVIFYLLYISNNNPQDINRQTNWGWVVAARPGSLDALQRYYISLIVLASLFLLFRHAYQMRSHKAKRNQTILVAFGILVPALQGILTQVVFPLILSREEIPLTSTFLTFFSIATLVALTRYKLFNLSESVEVDLVLGSLSNIVIIVSPDEKIMYMNAHARQVFADQQADELQKLLPANTYHNFYLEVFSKSLHGETVKNFQTRLKAGKRQVEVIVSSELIVNNHQVQGVLLVASDVTEKLQTLRDLKKSHERYNLVSKATNDMVWDWDLTTGRVYRNEEGWRKIFQRPIPSEVGTEQDWEAMIHPQDLEKLRAAKTRIRNGKENDFFEIECRVQKQDGSYAWILDRGYIVRNEDGSPARLIGASQDTTAKKQAELQLKEEQMRRQKEITDAVIIAQENERQKIGADLHDNVNQILACSLLYLNMTKKEGQDIGFLYAKTDEMINSAIQEIRKLSHSLIPPCFMGDSLGDALARLVEPAEKSGHFTVAKDFGSIDEKAISEKLKLTIYRIVQEQLNNILKYASANNVCIELRQQGSELTLSIKDDGSGFDTTKKAKGVGLMNITTRAQLHNGVVQIVSSPGNGCSVYVAFPLITEEKHAASGKSRLQLR